MAGSQADLTLVAIAKNEGRYIAEWLAFHLAVGVQRICVYVNDSTDDTAEIVRKLSFSYPVKLVLWPSAQHNSPQRSAYNHAIANFRNTTWMGFWDLDEFLVPFGYENVSGLLNAIPSDVTCIGINTRVFGSSGVTDPNYGSVLETFRRCSLPTFPGNRHIKSIVRPEAVSRMHIHHADMRYGRSVNAAFEALEFVDIGRTPKPIYAGVQVNHYRVKTLAEFKERRGQGNANHNPSRPRHFGRQFTPDGFIKADRNEVEDTTIEKFLPAFRLKHNSVTAALSARPSLQQRIRRLLGPVLPNRIPELGSPGTGRDV